MASPLLVNLSSLVDDAKCDALVRPHRWPDGVRCPPCASAAVTRNGRDDSQPHRQRYRCRSCASRFDDLTGTVLAGALQHRREHRVDPDATGVAVAPDLGERYLDTMYDDDWVAERFGAVLGERP